MSFVSASGGACRRRGIGPLIAALVASSLFSQGCAVTLGTLHAATGEWPTSSEARSKAWVGGEPKRHLTVETYLSTPPRAICEQRVWEPEVLVTRDLWGLDFGARLAIGFIGVGEMTLGLLPLILSDEVDVGAGMALGAIALDGLVTLIMAAAIPDTHKRSQFTEPSREYTVAECPREVAFEIRGRVLQVYSDGHLSDEDARYLMETILIGEPVFGLRNGDDLRRVDVPVEVQCDWATFLNHPAQRRVCPRPPVMVPVPVVPVRPPPIR